MHITSRHGRTAAWIAFPLAVVASGALIATASYAAFSDTTDNAGNVIGELKLIYNKTRQAGITKELSEIVSGAAAAAGV